MVHSSKWPLWWLIWLDWLPIDPRTLLMQYSRTVTIYKTSVLPLGSHRVLCRKSNIVMSSSCNLYFLAAVVVALYSSVSLAIGSAIPRMDTFNNASVASLSGAPVYYTCQVIAILSDESLNNTNCTGLDSLPGGYDVSIITPFKDEVNCTAAEISAREAFAAWLPADCAQFIISSKLCRGC